MALTAGFFGMVNAETITLQVADASNWVGEKSEEKVKDDGKLQVAAKYQPLVSFEIGDFKFTTEKGSGYTEPGYYFGSTINNSDPTLRIYKNNTLTVSELNGEEISQISYILKGKTEADAIAMTATGWSNTSGSNIQIIAFVITTGEGGGGGDVNPPMTDVAYENDFKSSLGTFTVENKVENDYKGWKINSSNPKCAIANSYVDGVNLESESWLISEVIDLANRSNCNVSFSQAFGWTFPTEQTDNYQFMIREENSTWTALEIENYPEKPAKNWSDWVENTFDIAGYDGKKVQFAFVYTNDGSTSRAWELQNFIVKGTPVSTAVAGLEVEDGEAVYFNLQGVRVAQPENGLYIRVQNGKATKFIAR